MTTREQLEAARELIRDPADWCSRPSREPYCAHFALGEVLGSRNGSIEGVIIFSPAFVALRKATERLGGDGYVGGFNDSHTHAEVLEAFHLAIADEIAREEADSRHMQEEQEREQAEDPAAPLVFA